MSDSTLPIACSLNDAEFRRREQMILQKVMRTVLERRELDGGCALRFPPDDDVLKEIVGMIILERKCCPFLEFKITLEAGGGDIWLEMTGAEGAKEFITETFK